MINRKGIYQAFDTTGRVEADERWQAITLPDGSIQLDNETVRVAPFDEPRSDSMTVILDPQLRLIEFMIHGLFGTRESRVCVVGENRDAATICWRLKGDIREKRIDYREDIELDWQTPLLNMLTVWRSKLQPGQARAFDCYYLDPVTFKPSLMKQIYTRHADEAHDTRFGPMTLQHYELDFGGDGKQISHFWCDDEGVLYDFDSPQGKFVLTAVNV